MHEGDLAAVHLRVSEIFRIAGRRDQLRAQSQLLIPNSTGQPSIVRDSVF